MTSKDKKIIPNKSKDLYIFEKTSRLIIGKCKNCNKKVRLIFPIEAAKIANVSLRDIFHLIEKNQIHFFETEEKLVIICSKSISDFVKRNKSPLYKE